MENEGVNALKFLFIVPILFIVGCFIVDFIPIIKEKGKVKDDMEYVIHMYNEGDTSRILSYSHNRDIKTNYTIEENKVNFVITKEVKVVTPVVKLIFGDIYVVTYKKSIDLKQ